MQWIIDGLILVIFLLFCILGGAKGFTKMITRLFGKVLAFVMACLFSSNVGNWLNEKYFSSFFHSVFARYVGEIAEKSGETVEETVNSLPAVFRTVADILQWDLHDLANQIRDPQQVNTVAESLSKPVSAFVGAAVGFALVFFGTMILAWLLGLLLDAICKLPVLSGFNKLLGVLLGALEGVLILFVLVALTEAVVPFLQSKEIIGELPLNQTILFGFIQSHNPLNYLFSVN